MVTTVTCGEDNSVFSSFPPLILSHQCSAVLQASVHHHLSTAAVSLLPSASLTQRASLGLNTAFLTSLQPIACLFSVESFNGARKAVFMGSCLAQSGSLGTTLLRFGSALAPRARSAYRSLLHRFGDMFPLCKYHPCSASARLLWALQNHSRPISLDYLG